MSMKIEREKYSIIYFASEDQRDNFRQLRINKNICTVVGKALVHGNTGISRRYDII